MAESTLSVGYLEIAREIGYVLSYGRDSSAWGVVGTPGTNFFEIDEVIQRGLRQFYNPPMLEGEQTAHEWTFLRPTTTLTTTAPYETGTVTAVAGVVTLAAGTWPSWAAQGELEISGSTYSVASRDSNSQLTLDDVSVAASAGSTYSLSRPAYTLPDSFGGKDGPMSYAVNTSGSSKIHWVDEVDIRDQLASPAGSLSAKPRIVAVRPQSSDGTTGQRFEAVFWPTPDAAYVLTYRYHALQDKLVTGEYPLGGMAHGETILASCLFIAYEMLARNEASGASLKSSAEKAWLNRLRASVNHDRQSMLPDNLGYNGDRSDGQDAINRRDLMVRVSYAGNFF